MAVSLETQRLPANAQAPPGNVGSLIYNHRQAKAHQLKSSDIFTKQQHRKLNQEIIDHIVNSYDIDRQALLKKLDEVGAIDRDNYFKDCGYKKLQNLYPISKTLDKNKVRKINTSTPKTTIRQAKYKELKVLLEAINQKVLLEYKIDNEQDFFVLLKEYFEANLGKF